MKLSIQLAGLLTFGILFAACDNSVDGQLQVRAPFTMIDKNGTEFTVSSDRKINVDPENVGDIGDEKVKLKLKDDDGKDRKVTLEVPSSQSIPQNGTLFLKGEDVGQPFDLLTDVSTETVDGPQTHGYESCTYQTQEYVCYNTPHGQQCRYQTVSRQGHRETIEHTRTTDVRAESTFMAAGTQTVVGTFEGARRDSYRVIDWQGRCGW